MMSGRCLVSEFRKSFFQNSAETGGFTRGRFCVCTFLTSAPESVPKNPIFSGKMSSVSKGRLQILSFFPVQKLCDSELVRSVFTHVPDQLGLTWRIRCGSGCSPALTLVLMGLYFVLNVVECREEFLCPVCSNKN